MEALVNQDISDECIDRIAVPSDKLYSYEYGIKFVDENEFVYHGKLYDIISKKTESTDIIFSCINDEQEEKLLKNFFAQVRHDNNITKNMNGTCANILCCMIKEVVFSEKALIHIYAHSEIHFLWQNTDILSAFTEVKTPPPRFSC
jgi:hypothetical protein